MKLIHQHHLFSKLLLLASGLLLLATSTGRAQTGNAIAQQLDVFYGETKILPVDGTIDSFAVVPENIVRVEKTAVSLNQLTLTGLSSGSAILTVKSNGRALVYDLTVTRAPERLYINLNESHQLNYPAPVDDNTLSDPGIVTVTQPDNNDHVLLVAADTVGKSTLTVFVGNDTYRYFISTFDNRGADILEIENAFSAKGYRHLTITFDKDQAIVGGTVPTQEELDDAVKIVRQFTKYVVVKAQLGDENVVSEYTEEESIIINNIQRIANVKGLTVRVKFPAPTVVTTSTETAETGDYIQPTVTTTPQGGTIRGSGFQAPPDPNDQNTATPNLELKPRKNVTEVTTITKDTTIPEKIFVYGDMADDLDEARVLRVARTFCPVVINFLTVIDPIQLRIKLRFMQTNKSDAKNTGVTWDNGTSPGLSATLGFIPNTFLSLRGGQNVGQVVSSMFSYGLTGAFNADATLNLFEGLDYLKELRQADLFLSNGQPGWYSEGEVRYYVSAIVNTAGVNTVSTSTSSPIFLGLNMDIAPLNVLNAGTSEPTGQRVLGLPATVSNTGSTYTVESNSLPSATKVGAIGTVQVAGGGSAPFIDSSTKYVDENGLIGLDVSTQLTVPGNFTSAGNGVNLITLPDVFIRSTRTRVSLRNLQTVALDGLIDEETSRNVVKVPFFADLPILGNLFKGYADTLQNDEVLVLLTPEIIRARDPDSKRYYKPLYREMQDLAAEQGDIPIIKPVRYAPYVAPMPGKDMKDTKETMNEPPPAPGTPSPNPPELEPLQPHASGGLQSLTPPPEPNAPPVDKDPQSPDTHGDPTSNPAPRLGGGPTQP